MRVEKIDLMGLRFSDNRAYGGKGEIKILAEDIKHNGLINPITVKEFTDGGDGDPPYTAYEVVAGRRRVEAVTLLGWKDIPCRILEGDEIERAEEIAGSENINRLGMHPLDEAEIFTKLLENGEPIEELAKRFDRPASAIWQRVQLLSLSDDLKAMFRNGNLSLHAAAMLKSLDEKGQAGFYNKYKDGWAVKQEKEIDIREVKTYISGRNHDRLYKFLMVKECQTCPKRTYYTDKDLFPELSDAEDACLDHECYAKRWNALLGAKIRNCKNDNPTHAEAAVLVIDSKIKKYLDKAPTFADTVYEVRAVGYYDDGCTDKPGKTTVPCLRIELSSYSETLKVSVKYLKNPQKEKQVSSERKTKDRYEYFEPITKLLELPAEEAKSIVDALTKGKKETWEFHSKVSDIERSVQKSTHKKIIEKMAKNPSEMSFGLFIEEFLGNFDDNTFAAIAGSLKIEDIKKLSSVVLYTALFASTFRSHDLPVFEDLHKPMKKTHFQNILDWAGMLQTELIATYKEEIQKLIPQTKAKVITDKDCEICKSANPTCSDCCLICLNPCNGKQICRKATKETKKPAAKKKGSGKRGMIKT